MLNLYRGDDLTLTIVDIVELSDTNNFTATSEPNYLRIYTTGSPNGLLLSKHVGLQADLPADEWMYLTETDEILLGQSYTGTVVTHDGTVFIFGDSGVAGSGSEAERTLRTMLTLNNEYSLYKCVDIDVSADEFFLDDDISVDMITFSLDDITYTATLDDLELLPAETQNFYVKMVIPEGTDTMNFRNVSLDVSFMTEFYE